MSGYSLFIRIFAPIYQKHYNEIRQLKALGPSFLHYGAYLWNSLNYIEQLRWDNIASTNQYNEESLRAEVLLFLIFKLNKHIT